MDVGTMARTERSCSVDKPLIRKVLREGRARGLIELEEIWAADV
jgi:hypothetical protein